MPSPFAHSSLLLLAPAAVRRSVLTALPRGRRWGLYALVLLALCAPDVDFLLRLLPERPMFDHGTFMHSLTVAVLFGGLFAAVAWWLLTPGLRRPAAGAVLWGLGTACYTSHLVLDMLTDGRGVMLLWPFWPGRIVSPVPLFVGASHSTPWAWRLHLVTLGNELILWLLFATVAWWLRRRRCAGEACECGKEAVMPDGGP